MRQVVIGLAAAAALMTSNMAQASKPSDRPSDSGARGAGSVLQASNPYHGVEATGMARAQARMQKMTHFEGRPAENQSRDRGGSAMKGLSGSGGGTAGSVSTSLNPYHFAEAGALARMSHKQQSKNGGQGPSMPAEGGGSSSDTASKNLKAMSSGGGFGVANSVRMGLNPYFYAEHAALGRMSIHQQAKNGGQGPSMPAESDGTRSDTASKNLKSMSGNGYLGVGNSVRMGLNPYYYATAASLGRFAVHQANKQQPAAPPDADSAGNDAGTKEMRLLTGGGHVSRPGGAIVGALNPYDRLEKQEMHALAASGAKGLSGNGVLRNDNVGSAAQNAGTASNARTTEHFRLNDLP
jgi:hypothetical protein